MKNLRNVFAIVLTAILAVTVSSCKKCRHENPTARIINNGTNKADVQVKTTGGNTININNVQPNTASDYNSYAPGEATFTINIANVNYVKVVDVVECFDYDIAIDASNNITVISVDRND